MTPDEEARMEQTAQAAAEKAKAMPPPNIGEEAFPAGAAFDSLTAFQTALRVLAGRGYFIEHRQRMNSGEDTVQFAFRAVANEDGSVSVHFCTRPRSPYDTRVEVVVRHPQGTVRGEGLHESDPERAQQDADFCRAILAVFSVPPQGVWVDDPLWKAEKKTESILPPEKRVRRRKRPPRQRKIHPPLVKWEKGASIRVVEYAETGLQDEADQTQKYAVILDSVPPPRHFGHIFQYFTVSSAFEVLKGEIVRGR